MPAPGAGPEIDFRQIAEDHMGRGGLFVYERLKLQAAARTMLNLEMPFGHIVRFAAKANPNEDVVKTFDAMGLHFDAAHPDEAAALLDMGVEGSRISLSSSTLPVDEVLERVAASGAKPIATSLDQIAKFGRLGYEAIGVRINPGKGSGHNNRTNTGGPASSFGIWHEQLDEVVKTAGQHGLAIDRLHTHIGSGADPKSWPEAITRSLTVVEELPDVTKLDIGGGYKIARMPDEEATEMEAVAEVFSGALEEFADRTDRQIELEFEPGTYLVGNGGTLLTRIMEKKPTPLYTFLILNAGMNANARPVMYGAQHDMEVLNDATEHEEYIVQGPACESGDVQTPEDNDPEGLKPRLLNRAAVDDILAIYSTGAYGLTMATVDYCHIPKATEVVV